MTTPTLDYSEKRSSAIEPLRWIGAYRLVKGVLTLIGAIVLFRLMHDDLPATALHWMHRLRIEADSKVGEFILRKAVDIPPARIGFVALFLLGYTFVAFTEGIGLILRKTWAEWLTVLSTFALVPLEIWELARRPTWTRVLILVLNVLMVVYLMWRIQRDRARASRQALDRAALAEALTTTPNQERKPE
jgi:uncharacterized membrane protein (DUF2068 family)